VHCRKPPALDAHSSSGLTAATFKLPLQDLLNPEEVKAGHCNSQDVAQLVTFRTKQQAAQRAGGAVDNAAARLLLLYSRSTCAHCLSSAHGMSLCVCTAQCKPPWRAAVLLAAACGTALLQCFIKGL